MAKTLRKSNRKMRKSGRRTKVRKQKSKRHVKRRSRKHIKKQYGGNMVVNVIKNTIVDNQKSIAVLSKDNQTELFYIKINDECRKFDKEINSDLYIIDNETNNSNKHKIIVYYFSVSANQIVFAEGYIDHISVEQKNLDVRKKELLEHRYLKDNDKMQKLIINDLEKAKYAGSAPDSAPDSAPSAPAPASAPDSAPDSAPAPKRDGFFRRKAHAIKTSLGKTGKAIGEAIFSVDENYGAQQ